MKFSPLQLLALVPILLTGPAVAGIFDEPQNLEVLPDDISAQELSATMRGFAMGLGLRCSNCHMGEEGQDLSEYDFASDEKELKLKAREMMKMVKAINREYLDKIQDGHVEVQCVTCHRGVNEPKLLGQVLTEAADEKGATAIRETYFALKERYYGSHSYDFTERSMGGIARSLGEAEKMDEAKTILDIMLEENPESFQGHFLFGEFYRLTDDTETAIAYYRKALEINPQAVFVERRIAQMQQE